MKKNLLRETILLVAVLFASTLFAQDWVKMMHDPNANFYDVQKAFNKYYEAAKVERDKDEKTSEKSEAINEEEEEENGIPGYAQFRRWEWFMKPRVSQTGERFDPSTVWKEMTKYRQQFGTSSGSSDRKTQDKTFSGAGSWTPVGPANSSGIPGAGRLNMVRVNPLNAKSIWVGAPSGGLWHSVNGGTSWTTNTDWTAQVIGYSDLAFSYIGTTGTVDTNTIYVTTGDRDNGDSYTVGLLKSTDGGATWNTTGLSFSMGAYRTLTRVLVDPSNANNVYVSSSAGIYKSTNAGVTFTNVLTGSFFDMKLKPGTSSTIYCCGTTFYYSINSGSTWTAVTTGITAAASLCRMSIAVSPISPTTVYLLSGLAAPNYGFDGFYVSVNSGVSFTKRTSTPATFGNQEWYDLAIAANPTTANEVMIGGQTVCYKCTNANVAACTWTQIANGSTHVDYHDIFYASGTSVYIASDGGVYGSTNDGGAWTNLNNNLVIAEQYGFGQSTSNANLLITGHQDNGTNIYNGNWTSALGGDGVQCFIDWNNDQNMWASYPPGSAGTNTNLEKYTTAGGWTAVLGNINEQGLWYTPFIQDPVTAGTVYAGFVNVWKSVTGGGTWTKLGTISTGTVTLDAIAVSPANTQVIWAAGGGALYKTSNGGTTWTTITALPGGTISYIACSSTNANIAWVTYSGFSNKSKVFQTNDQGTTWTNLSASLPNIPINCITVDKNGKQALYIGTDVGVFYKDSTLTIWQPFSNNLPNVEVTQLEIFYSGSKIRASTYGRGAWESGLYTAGAYPPSANFGASEQIGCPGMGVQFTDYSAGQPTSWSWTFQSGNPPTSNAQNPFVAYNTPGTYSVSLTVTNANGPNTKTSVSYITVSPSQPAPTVAGGKNFCGPAALTLTATPTAAGTVRWWNAAGGGNIVGTGTTFTTPSLNATTTYYVDETFSSGGTDNVGELDNTTGAGAMFSANDIRGLYFDVTQPVVINKRQVYCNSTGIRDIAIIDANGNQITDTTLTIPGNPTTLQTVTINRTVYPGTGYFMKFNGLVDCYRNTAGAVYPLTSASGDVTITGENAGAPGYYYFFYNWTFTKIVCNTGRTSVTVTDTCSATGIKDLFANNHIDVYPNPNNGTFTFAFQTVNKDDYKIKIANILGQTVYEEALNDFNGNYSKMMDLGSYGKGVYMLSISNSKNQTVKKVIVY